MLFVIGPGVLDVAAMLTGGSMRSWQPDLGTRVAPAPRSGDGPVRFAELEPFWVWHFANGCGGYGVSGSGAAAIDAAAARKSSRRPLVTSPASRCSISGRRTVRRATRSDSPESFPHFLRLGGAADEVGEHEQPDTGAPVVRRHRRQVLQHQSELARAITGPGARPAQVVQVE